MTFHDIVNIHTWRPKPFYTAQFCDLLHICSEEFNVSKDDILGPSRKRPHVMARWTIWSLARDLRLYSFKQLGNKTGGRDHSTCCTAIRALVRDLERFPEYRAPYRQALARVAML